MRTRQIYNWLAAFVIITLVLSAAGTPSRTQAAPDGPLPAGLCGSDSALVGCWPMDEGSGATISDVGATPINDGNLLGNISPSPWVAGYDDLLNALKLDGSTHYVTVPDENSLDIATNRISIAAWIKPEQATTQDLVKKANSTTGFELSLSVSGATTTNQRVFVRFNGTGSSIRVNSIDKYPIDGSTWWHAVATYDGTTVRLYINGDFDNSLASTFTLAANTLPLTIGADNTGGRKYKGAIDDVRIYNRVLSDAEILALYSNHRPAAVADSYSTNLDTTLNVSAPGVLSNDTDADADALTAIKISNPAHGALTLNGDGSFAYTPTTGYTGPDSFTYRAADGKTSSNVATVSITVGQPNNPPVVTNPGPQASSEGQTISLQIQASDLDSDPLTYAATGLPENLSINPSTGEISGTLTYHAGEASPYAVTVTVNDDQGGSTPVDFTWGVNQAASALCSEPTAGLVGCWPMEENAGTLLIDATANGNDGALTGSPSWVTGKTGAYALYLNGSANALIPDDPSLDITGQITLAVWVKPEQTTTQNLIKKAVNSNTNGYELSLAAAGSAADQKYFVRFNQTTSGDTFRVNSTVNYPADGSTWVHIAATYDGTTIRLYVDGVENNYLTPATPPTIVVNSLNLGIGSDSLNGNRYKGAIDDGRVYNRALTSEEIETLAGANRMPVAVDDSYNTNEDITLNVPAPGVLANDLDADGNPLTAIKVTDPAHGTLTLNSDGSFIYNPTPDYHGPDSFTYRASDGLTQSLPATVNITVNPVNDAPVAVDDSYSVAQDGSLSVPAPGLLTNDTDPDLNPLTAIQGSDPLHGQLSAFSSDGSFTYTPTAGYSGPDSFTYKANDGALDSNVATVNLSVSSQANQPPTIANPGAQTNSEGQTISLQILAADPDNDPLTYSATGLPPGLDIGSTTGLIAGSLGYESSGVYNVLVTAQDGRGGADAESFIWTVNNVVLPPGGLSCSDLTPKPATASTGEKPQSKVWRYGDAWWSVFPTNASGASSAGTWLWKLDGTAWSEVLKLSDSTSVKADIKVAENIVHALLYTGTSTQLVSAEFNGATYQPWTTRPAAVNISLSNSEIATIDLDSTGRMWLATENDATDAIVVHYSDSPYSTWNGPLILATGVNDDDIAGITSLPSLNAIGVLWSNQNTQRFGFRLHADGSDPAAWAADEAPASQSAQNVGLGMADDHLNLAVASDGTLYAAVKTSYDSAGYPKVSLLVRRPAGTWDDLYEVDQAGTRAIVLLDEIDQHLTVVYTSAEGYNSIVYKQSALNPISFGSRLTMRAGSFNDVSDMKQNYTDALLVLFSNSSEVAGELCTSVLPAGADLAITKDNGQTTVTPGAEIVYTIRALNNGPAAVTGATVQDTLPALLVNASWTCSASAGAVCTASGSGNLNDTVNLPRGASVTYTLRATLRLDAQATLANTATVAVPGGVTELVPANNTSIDSDTIGASPTGCESNPNLVGCWQMEEGSGTTIYDGGALPANDGAVVGGPTWVSGAVGQALDLDGANQYAWTPDETSLDIASNITLAAWVKPEQYATQSLLTKAVNGSLDGYEISLSTTKTADPPTSQKVFVRFNQVASGDTYRVNSTQDYPIDGAWIHVSATYDGTTIRLFINGTLDASLPATIPIVTNDVPLSIGAQRTALGVASRWFMGAIDEARVYRRVLAPEEIAILAGHPPAPLAAPTNLSAILALGSQIDLSWTDNASNETSFALEYAASLNCASVTTWSSLGATGLDTTTFRHWNTAVDTQYCYRVRAANAGGVSAWSNIATATTPESYSALSLGRDHAYVRMTTSPQTALQLSQFTLETWFRREGPGASNTTGTSGVESAIPLIAKGAPEADNSNVDENYILCINDTTDTLCADFEEGATGASPGLNHPVNGVTTIVNGQWYHAAVTYDGASWNLYLNGTLETTLAVNQPVRSDNISPAALATMLESNGAPHGFFDGSLDEVRIWNYARSESEVRSTMNSQIAGSTPGLAARWALDEASGTAVNGSAGTTINGSIYPASSPTGWNWTQDAPFNASLAPDPPASPVPAAGAYDVLIYPGGGSDPLNYVELQATVSDADSSLVTVSYYGRPYCQTPNFTLAALPDTQYYSSQTNSGTIAMFDAQTQWIVDNKANRNIVYTTHLGDIVDSYSDTAQWDRANEALTRLETGSVAYGLAIGNHDGAPASTGNFNSYFGTTRFSGRPYYGGSQGSDNDNNYGLFSSGGLDFIVIHIEYGADVASRDWANTLLQTNSTRRAIVVTHNLLSGNTTPASFTTEGQALYDALKGNPNLFLMLGGHLDTEVSRTDTYNGHTVYSLRSDFQTRSGGNGWLRLMEFQPAANQIQVYTYSPYLNQWETDANSQFTLTYNMGGAGCQPFELIQTVPNVPSGSSPKVLWGDRSVVTQYEWYATVNDGTHLVTSPVWWFESANDPTAITVTNFNATTVNQTIQLSWETAQEVHLVGFNLYRAETIDGARLKINPSLIPAKTHGRMFGNSYLYEDALVEPGKPYHYWIEILSSGGTEITGPVWAMITFQYKIWLPNISR